MNYIFDIDDTLLFSEIVKKRTYFDYLEIFQKEKKISEPVQKKALAIASEILHNNKEKDIFDTALQILKVIYPNVSQDQLEKEALLYVNDQMKLLRYNYQSEVKEVTGAMELLKFLHNNGSILGINTGNQISFAKQVVSDRGWPISLDYVLKYIIYPFIVFFDFFLYLQV